MSKVVFDRIADPLREAFDAATDITTIIFFREGVFYLTEYPSDYTDWQAEADRNPGTLRIEDVHGNVLWEAPRLSA